MRPRLTTKLLSAAASLVLIGLSSCFTASIALERTAPATSLVLWPGNGGARARVSDMIFRPQHAAELEGKPVDAPTMRQAVRQARKAIHDQALNPRALRVIALGSTSEEARRFAMLEKVGRLTRRDTLTQLWLVQRYALSEDVDQTLAHYDALLRRDTAARDLAGQTLAQAMAHPQMVQEVSQMLRSDPDWKSLLFHYLLRQPESWDGFIELHRRLADSAIIPAKTSFDFAAGLMAAGRIEDAVQVAGTVGAEPLKRSAGLLDNEFAVEPPFPGAWAVADNAVISLQPLAEGGALLDIGRGSGGVLARRLVALEPGSYRATLIAQALESSLTSAKLEARLTCARAAGELAGAQSLVVTGDCPYQWLSIYLERPPLNELQMLLDSLTIGRDD